MDRFSKIVISIFTCYGNTGKYDLTELNKFIDDHQSGYLVYQTWWSPDPDRKLIKVDHGCIIFHVYDDVMKMYLFSEDFKAIDYILIQSHWCGELDEILIKKRLSHILYFDSKEEAELYCELNNLGGE